MTVKQLLKPRYKVIADYPGNPFDIGDILLLDDTTGSVSYVLEGEIGNSLVRNYIATHDIQKYPHLFRKLEWWEERKPEEMSEYVYVLPRRVHPRHRNRIQRIPKNS